MSWGLERQICFAPIKTGFEKCQPIHRSLVVADGQTTEGQYVRLGKGVPWHTQVVTNVAGQPAQLNLYNEITGRIMENVTMAVGATFIIPDTNRVLYHCW